MTQQCASSHLSAGSCSRSSSLWLKQLVPLTPRRVTREGDARLPGSGCPAWRDGRAQTHLSRGAQSHRGCSDRGGGVSQGAWSRPKGYPGPRPLVGELGVWWGPFITALGGADSPGFGRGRAWRGRMVEGGVGRARKSGEAP